MAKTIIIKLTRSGPKAGPFDVYDQVGNLIASGVSKNDLIKGKGFSVDDSVTIVTLKEVGKCSSEKSHNIGVVTPYQLTEGNYVKIVTACLWRHLTDIKHFNYYYGNIEPYVIEYPFAYQYQDEILQSVQDFTKAFKYLPDGTGVFTYANKIEVNDEWFNKAILYNGQQSSGILELVPKPKNNLKLYMSYPIYRADSKVITFTKSDSFYQYNNFWSIVKDKTSPLFTTSCDSLSIDKTVNQTNMDYTVRSFKKEPLRAKDVRVRHILDNSSDVHLVSQFIVQSSQISYK